MNTEVESMGTNGNPFYETAQTTLLADLNEIRNIKNCLREEDRAPTIAEQRTRDREEAILATLARIDDRSYGMCVKCGEPISEKRLRALPTATCCISCAREMRAR